MHSNNIPSSRALETEDHPPRKIILYIAAAAVIVLAVYYLPNYLFLERVTADSTALLLNSLGLGVRTNVVGGHVFLAEIQVVKDCTGVQVIAVFLGLLIPLPGAPWKKKLLALAVVSASLYVANILRIALEFSLVYLNLLPWSLAHYPLSLLLGVVGVFVLVLVTDRLLPEFGDFILSFSRTRAA
jgi:exosortase/archaeosortase family protein